MKINKPSDIHCGHKDRWHCEAEHVVSLSISDTANEVPWHREIMILSWVHDFVTSLSINSLPLRCASPVHLWSIDRHRFFFYFRGHDWKFVSMDLWQFRMGGVPRTGNLVNCMWPAENKWFACDGYYCINKTVKCQCVLLSEVCVYER